RRKNWSRSVRRLTRVRCRERRRTFSLSEGATHEDDRLLARSLALLHRSTDRRGVRPWISRSLRRDGQRTKDSVETFPHPTHGSLCGLRVAQNLFFLDSRRHIVVLIVRRLL